MRRPTLSMLCVLAATILPAGLGCESMTAVDRDTIPDEGTGGAAGQAGGGSGGAAGQAGGGSGGAAGQAGGGSGGAAGQAGGADAGTPCTTVDDCPATGSECVVRTCENDVCGTANAADDTTCDDGSLCTTSDVCKTGVCAGAAVACTASDACHGVGQCDPTTGECSNPALPDDTVCSDSNICTDPDTCASGVCVGAFVTDNRDCGVNGKCNDQGQCVGCIADTDCADADANDCKVPRCDAGVCGVKNAAEGTACDDGSLCTTDDKCDADSACGGTAKTCAAIDQCHGAGECVLATGECSAPAADDGTVCDDGDLCSGASTCHAGVCTGADLVTCVGKDACHLAGICQPLTGECTDPNAPDDTTCDDGNDCTGTDVCTNGACAGGDLPVNTACGNDGKCDGNGQCLGCLVDDDCTDAKTTDCTVPWCDAGVCKTKNADADAPCQDASLCTLDDKCDANGKCVPGAPKVCVAIDCHYQGYCNPATGNCSDGAARPEGSPCSDGNACTLEDHCSGGKCYGFQQKVCQPNDVCHVKGVCVPADGSCTDVPGNDGKACDFGDMCKTGKTCVSGACVGGTDKTCNDGDDCTDDTCAPNTGCVHTINPANSCSDGNDCTDDTCELNIGCVHTIDTTNGCSDGNLCTLTDTCNAQGFCVSGTPVVCADPDQCQNPGTCDPSTGTCSYKNKPGGTACNDGRFCTAYDLCVDGVCQGISVTQCTTTDQCKITPGVCDSLTDACVFGNATDGKSCTSFSHKPAECVDANTLRTYTSVASCVSGVCAEKHTDATCALGCTAGVCKNDLQITEYIEGNGYFDEALEITNHSGSPIELSTCSIRIYESGATTPGYTIALTGTLAAGASHVVCGPDSYPPAEILARCTQQSNQLRFDGDDAIELICGTTVRDVIGRIGEDPGLEWGGGETGTNDNVLVRKCSIIGGDTNATDAFDPADQWVGISIYTNLGTHCRDTKTMTIDGINGFSPTLEKFDALDGYSAYATWGATSLYLGMEGPDVGQSDPQKWWLVYIGGANGTLEGVTYKSATGDPQRATLPFSAKYHYRWRTDGLYTNRMYWDHTLSTPAWVDDGDVPAKDWNRTGSFIEMAIPFADIGGSSTIRIHMAMLNEADDSEWTWAPFPSTSFTPGKDPDYSRFYQFIVTGPVAPTTYAPLP